MDDQIRDLACARAAMEELKEERDEVQREIRNSVLWIQLGRLKKRITDMKDACLELDEQIRTDALKEYEKTGNKHPHPAVSVSQPWEHPWGSTYTDDPYVRIKRDLSAYLGEEESEAADGEAT